VNSTISTVRPRRGKRIPRFKRPGSWLRSLLAKLRFGVFSAVILGLAGWWFHDNYTFSVQSPVRLHFQSPVVITKRVSDGYAAEAQADQSGKHLTAWQQYACQKFGSDCRLALAIQRAENPAGKCEIYHYNTDGTLDWGYFQINTVHLKRAGVNLRDLLDCKANIDFAYQLYRESHGFTPWTTYNSGAYRQYLR
jgi:hypothetical protein